MEYGVTACPDIVIIIKMNRWLGHAERMEVIEPTKQIFH